jgi:hypothetical protein
MFSGKGFIASAIAEEIDRGNEFKRGILDDQEAVMNNTRQQHWSRASIIVPCRRNHSLLDSEQQKVSPTY